MSLLNTLRFVTSHPLNKKQKVHALLRFLRWQIGARLVPGPVLFNWVADTRVFIRRSETGMTQNLYCGLHEFTDMAYVLHVMTSDDLFVDVGANAGSYTLLACSVKGARGFSFEPNPSTYRRLAANIAINNLCDRVLALNMGLAHYDGELIFTDDEDTMNHVVPPGETASAPITVPVRTLDSVLSAESPSMIKIDVEGFEQPVLQGAEMTLRKASLHSVLIELNGSGARYGFDENRIMDQMKSFGFVAYAYEPFARELVPLSAKNLASGNTLFLRNENFIRDRLRRAPQVSIHSTEF
jgi:FkbM family methyltransferase